jgi:hypothetical protein
LHIVEAVLNYVSGSRTGVAGVYNRAAYEREIRAALFMWADHVRSVVDGAEARSFRCGARHKRRRCAPEIWNKRSEDSAVVS